jgi:hypothetical protein
MRTLISVTLLLLALPVLAQAPPIVGSRARYQDIHACLEKNASVYDDRISSAEVVARALIAMCQSVPQDARSPHTTVMRERDALQDDAVMVVLKARAKEREAPVARDSDPTR